MGPNQPYIFLQLASGGEFDCEVGFQDAKSRPIFHVNMQLNSWCDALSDWENMRDDPSRRQMVRYGGLIQHIGASLGALLGQNAAPLAKLDAQKRTPDIRTIFQTLIRIEEAPLVLREMSISEQDLAERFDALIDAYDAVRHQGPSKETVLCSLDFVRVTAFMKTAQDVWQLVIRLYYENRGRSVDGDQLCFFRNNFCT